MNLFVVSHSSVHNLLQKNTNPRYIFQRAQYLTKSSHTPSITFTSAICLFETKTCCLHCSHSAQSLSKAL